MNYYFMISTKKLITTHGVMLVCFNCVERVALERIYNIGPDKVVILEYFSSLLIFRFSFHVFLLYASANVYSRTT
jgi:hypothetical protein